MSVCVLFRRLLGCFYFVGFLYSFFVVFFSFVLLSSCFDVCYFLMIRKIFILRVFVECRVSGSCKGRFV